MLLIVSSSLSINARPERSIDLNEISCRFLTALAQNTSVDVTAKLPACGDPTAPPKHGSVKGDPLMLPLNSGIKLLVTSLASGLAVMIAIYIAGGLSSAHLNPIVTLAVKYVDNPPHFTWLRCFIYFCVQVLGSFLAGLVAIVSTKLNVLECSWNPY